MDFFRRIGTDRHKFKVQFFLKKLKCDKKLNGDVYVTIKRGDHKKSTQGRVPMGEDGVCNFQNQILTFQALTLFYDTDEKVYQEKQGEIRLVIITKKGDKKLLGNIEFDLSKFANSNKQSHKITKQFGDKIKMVFQYEVYIKFLGQASQTSKSVSKQESNRKKQSSLSKFVTFFKGEDQDDQTQKEKQKQKEAQKKQGKMNNKSKDKKISVQKYTKKPIQPMSEKRDKKKEQDSEQEDSDEQFKRNTLRNKKNMVATRGKDTLTQKQGGSMREYDQSRPTKENSNEKKSQKIFFDDPKTFNKVQKSHHQSAGGIISSNQKEEQKSHMGIKRTQKFTSAKQNFGEQSQKNNLIQQLQQKLSNLQKQFQAKDSQYEKQRGSHVQKIISLEQKIRNLQKQNRKLEQKNMKLTNQNQQLQKSLKEKPVISSQAIFQTERDYGQGQFLSKQGVKIKQLQKDKGQLLVKIQKMQEKYDTDFKKFQQICQQYEQQKQQGNGELKGQLKRVKQELSQQKAKYEKIISKYEQKNTQMKQFKQKQNQLKDQLATAMNNLSQMKLKIGDMLNDANQQNDVSLIDALTLLSQT